MKESSFDEFNDWFQNSFLKRNGGWFPRRIDKWFDRVNKSHKELRDFIGSDLIQKTYKIPSEQKIVKIEEVQPTIDAIKAIVPSYLSSYGYTDEIFLMPTLGQGTHNAIKVSKHIKNYLGGLYCSYSPQTKQLNKLLSDLGSIWARNRTSESEVEITLSTTAKGFVLLGHYGPDQDSCWRQGSTSPYDKYVISQSPNTFVLTLSKFNDQKKKNINVARCFGFANENFNTLNLANYYFSPSFQEGDAIEIIRMLFEDLWKDKSSFHEKKIGISGDIFHNTYGNWSFSKGEKTKIGSQLLKLNSNNICHFICPKCDQSFKDDNRWEDVDEMFVCHYCIAQAKKCDISGILTFQSLIEAVGNDGFPIMIHPDITVDMNICDCCEKYTSSYTEIEGQKICADCVESRFTHCDSCQEFKSDEEIEDTMDDTICKSCISLNPLENDIYSLS